MTTKCQLQFRDVQTFRLITLIQVWIPSQPHGERNSGECICLNVHFFAFRQRRSFRNRSSQSRLKISVRSTPRSGPASGFLRLVSGFLHPMKDFLHSAGEEKVGVSAGAGEAERRGFPHQLRSENPSSGSEILHRAPKSFIGPDRCVSLSEIFNLLIRFEFWRAWFSMALICFLSAKVAVSSITGIFQIRQSNFPNIF